MKLTSFRVQNYKVVEDTGWVPVDPRVTALVGKNESGKTAIMKALWKSKNVAGVHFDKLLDFPRHRYARERRGVQEVTSLEFALTPEESTALLEQFSIPLKTTPQKVWITTYYEGETGASTHVRLEDRIESRCARRADQAIKTVEAVARELARIATAHKGRIEGYRQAIIGAIREEDCLWDSRIVRALDEFAAAIEAWIEEDASRKDLARQQRTALTDLLATAKQGDPAAAARRWIVEHAPAFIYFDSYALLASRIHLPTFLKFQGREDGRTRTHAALFEWSRLDPKEILDLGGSAMEGESESAVQRRRDVRRALLDSASSALTGEWIEWWTEKRHRLHFSADGEELLLAVSDEHNEYPIVFDERSHGFQWFFSFYLVFLVESAKAHRGTILLLDEPGLHLHPTLQSKLVSLFEGLAGTSQVIYSTHLPFLVDGAHLERVRTVYLPQDARRKSKGVMVSSNGTPEGDYDTLFPLQAALGYSMAEALVHGERAVLVESLSDFWLLSALSDGLGALGDGQSLDPRVRIVPVGGAVQLFSLASLMHAGRNGSKRRMVVLSRSGGVSSNGWHEIHPSILSLADFVDCSQAEVEDLVPREQYAEAARKGNGRVRLNNREKDEPSNLAAMTRLYRRMKWGRFGQTQRTDAAMKLAGAWLKNPRKIPASTRPAARKLFAAINERLA